MEVFSVFIISAIAVAALLPLIALISVLKNSFKDNDKLIWILVILFIPYLGALLYFAFGRSKKL